MIRELVSGLRALEDPATQRPMFDHVYSKLDVFMGSASSGAPDVVFFDEEMKYSAHRMFELGSNRLVTPHPIYSGNHKMDGIMFASGEGVKNVPDISTLESPRLVDLTPTIFHWLECDPMREMDGRPLYDLFETPRVSSRAGQMDEPAEESRIMLGARNLRSRRGL